MTGAVDGHFVSFSADYGLLNTGTKRAEGIVDRGSRRMAASFDQLSVMGGRFAAGFASFFVVDKLVDVGMAAVNAASDVEEMQSKFNVVFAELSGQASAFAEVQAEAVGRAVSEYKGYLSSLQDTFVPMGFARDEAFELAKGLSALGVDLASFNNTTDPEAINSLTSALVGNHEAVRKYGVQITEASLKQALLDQGFKGNVANASEQQKVLARLSIILRSTSDAQGDAARTAEGFANQSKRLKGELKSLGEDIGKDVLPWITEMTKSLGNGIKMFRDFYKEVQTRDFSSAFGGDDNPFANTDAAKQLADLASLRGAIDQTREGLDEYGAKVKEKNADEASGLSESEALYARVEQAIANMFSQLESGTDSAKAARDELTNADNWRIGTTIEMDPAYQADLAVAKQEFAVLQQFGSAISSRLTQGFSDFAKGSKTAFKDMAKALLVDLATILFKAIAVKAVLSALGLPTSDSKFAPSAGGSSSGIGQNIFGGAQSLTGGASVSSVQSAVASAGISTASVPVTGPTYIYQIDAKGADVGAKERVEEALIASQNQPSAVEQVSSYRDRFPTGGV